MRLFRCLFQNVMFLLPLLLPLAVPLAVPFLAAGCADGDAAGAYHHADGATPPHGGGLYMGGAAGVGF